MNYIYMCACVCVLSWNRMWIRIQNIVHYVVTLISHIGINGHKMNLMMDIYINKYQKKKNVNDQRCWCCYFGYSSNTTKIRKRDWTILNQENIFLLLLLVSLSLESAIASNNNSNIAISYTLHVLYCTSAEEMKQKLQQ